MKITIVLATGILLFAVGSVHAAPATDLQKFEKRVAKVAPPDASKGKVFCACAASDSFYANRVGFLQQYVSGHQLYVRCSLEIFDGAGAELGTAVCDDFYALK